MILEGLCGETSDAELCRREKINPSEYYKWSKDLLNLPTVLPADVDIVVCG